MNVLIIEDELKAARELKTLVENINPAIKVCSILQSVEEAVSWLNDNEMPNLILSDIQLADGLCFDIFRLVKVSAPVIFCTAYDDYALEAFENNGIDYLLKPVEDERLLRSFDKMTRMSHLFSLPDYKKRLDKVVSSFHVNYTSALYVHLGNRIVSVDVKEIDFFYTSEDIVFVNSRGHRYEVRSTLDQLMTELDPKFFYRANRQFVINRQAVREVDYIEARKLEIILIPPSPEKVIVSKSKSTQFIRWLKESNS